MSFEDFEKQLKSKQTSNLPDTSMSPKTTGGSPFDVFESQISTAQTNVKERAPQGDGLGMSMLKGLVAAPATMVARPIQAVQSGVQLYNMDIGGNEAKAKQLSDEAYNLSLSLRTAPESEKPAIRARVQELTKQSSDISNKLAEGAEWKPSAGGIVAEAPENFADVKKDIGRGIQTVALGVGSPMAAGAAYGFGTSLEQGNDIMSTETLVSTLTGLGLGKALDVIGKPIINAAGKVIGAVNLKMLKEATSKGQKGVTDFMAKHELLGGVVKPISEQITKGAEKFDSTINKTASSMWKGTKSFLSEQYSPQKKALEQHFEQKETDKILGPAKNPGKTFKSSSDVLAEAERRGVNLEQKIKDTKIYNDVGIDEKGRFDTNDARAALLDDTMSKADEVLIPAFEAAQPGVKLVSSGEVFNSMLKQADNIPIPEDRAKFIRRIIKEYGPTSAEANAFKKGYKLVDLYKSKNNRISGVYKTPKGGGETKVSDRRLLKEKELESKAFNDLLRERAPKEIGLDDYFKAQEDKFVLANLLETLNGKVAPRTRFQKAFDATSQIAGGILGYKLGGPLGIFPGRQFGSLVEDTIVTLPNPLKIAALKRIPQKTPEIYDLIKKYTDIEKAARGSRLKITSGKTAKEKIKETGVNVLTPDTKTIPLEYPFRPTTEQEKRLNDIVRQLNILQNTKQLKSPDFIPLESEGIARGKKALKDFYKK